MNLTRKKPFRSVRGNKSPTRSKEKYFLISDLPNAEWLITELERELNCWVQYVPLEDADRAAGIEKRSKFTYTALGTLRRFAEKARILSGLDAGFAISGYCGQTSAASFLKMQTRHILFTDFEKKTEVYESECLPFSRQRADRSGISSGETSFIVSKSELLWNFSGLISKLKRNMGTLCPECHTHGWAPVMKSERFKLGNKMVGGEEVWLCKTCDYSILKQPG